MARFEAASLMSARVLTLYGMLSTIAFGAMIYKARQEQLDLFMASAGVHRRNGCLLVCLVVCRTHAVLTT